MGRAESPLRVSYGVWLIAVSMITGRFLDRRKSVGTVVSRFIK